MASPSPLKPSPSPRLKPKPGPAHHYAHVGINILHPDTKHLFFFGIIDESVRGIEYNIRALAVGKKLEEHTKLGGGCLEQVVEGHMSGVFVVRLF